MNMKATTVTPKSPFSVSLIENSFKHKLFLQQIHALGVSLNDQPCLRSVKRYLAFWLPLVKKYPDVPLIPPADIAWLWHCHRLAPKPYEDYVLDKFGVLLDARLPFALLYEYAETYSHNSLQTQILWESEFPGEPFFVEKTHIEFAPKESDHLFGGFDLLGSCKRQTSFLWQISTPHFNDIGFLKRAAENYGRFLLLMSKAQHHGITIVPTIQIEMMWHTHILSSIDAYNVDCKVLVGSTVSHDDSLYDRMKIGTCMWFEEFKINYEVDGGMYRGTPPNTFHSPEWQPANVLGNITETTPGGSSTATDKLVLKWATMFDEASDGSPTFVASSDTEGCRTLLKNNKNNGNYIVGKGDNGFHGYYHFETKDAHKILQSHTRTIILKLEFDIGKQSSFCGLSKAYKTKRAELKRQHEVYNEIYIRTMAAQPSRLYNCGGDFMGVAEVSTKSVDKGGSGAVATYETIRCTSGKGETNSCRTDHRGNGFGNNLNGRIGYYGAGYSYVDCSGGTSSVGAHPVVGGGDGVGCVLGGRRDGANCGGWSSTVEGAAGDCAGGGLGVGFNEMDCSAGTSSVVASACAVVGGGGGGDGYSSGSGHGSGGCGYSSGGGGGGYSSGGGHGSGGCGYSSGGGGGGGDFSGGSSGDGGGGGGGCGC